MDHFHLHCYLNCSGTHTTNNSTRAANKRRLPLDKWGCFDDPLPFQRPLKIGAPYEAKTDQQVGLVSSRAPCSCDILLLSAQPWHSCVSVVPRLDYSVVTSTTEPHDVTQVEMRPTAAWAFIFAVYYFSFCILLTFH